MLLNKKLLILLPLVAHINTAWAQEKNTTQLQAVVVTEVMQDKPNTIQFNTKTAIQPLPANDGAGILKSIPNMSIIRKGGSSGDPLFRGLGGTRLSIQADDQFIYGGCGGRMDPPTAYIFPTAYDKVIITKGPQTVTQGMGLITGAVRYVRKDPSFTDHNTQFQAAYTIGNFGRHDAMIDAAAGNSLVFARLNATYNTSDDYQDGDGKNVHSSFSRNSQMAQVGLTPSTNTLITATYERSRGQAAYSDRMMDGSQFDRDAWNIRAVQRNMTDWFSELEFRYGQSVIDHVMDNFSLRTVMPGKEKKLSNPKRNTDTAQLKGTFNFNQVELQAGVDYMRDRHVSRGGVDYATKAYMPNQSFDQWGGFAEANWGISNHQNLIAGYRYDTVKAIFENQTKFPLSNPLREQRFNLHSGFIRFEQRAGDAKYYIGIGSAQRSPDYWERNRNANLKAERNNQIDAGAIWQSDRLHASLSLFASQINNFILIDNNLPDDKTARNIEALRLGGELEVNYRITDNWRVGSNLAYTYGQNKTDKTPLAQTPPLEWHLSARWDNNTYSVGALWRVVAAQNRYVKGQGNIIGQDVGPSEAFNVLSLNAGWKASRYITVQAGVDNVFNTRYAEFINKAGNPSAGVQTIRVNEPGRQYWLRGQVQFN